MKIRCLLPALLLAFGPLLPLHAQDEDQGVFSAGVSVDVAPPELPSDEPPPCPQDGYIWTPGLYTYTNAVGYYWVPGVWEAPPVLGYLWTPGYWGYTDGFYAFNTGYWGPTVGFYGGVDYGYGYGGYGYYGGRWDHNRFVYNTAAVRVNRTVVHNTYTDRQSVVSHTLGGGRRTSFNGGRGGTTARANAAQLAAARGPHVRATAKQMAHVRNASPARVAKGTAGHAKGARSAGNQTRKGMTTPRATNTVRNNARTNPRSILQNGTRTASTRRATGTNRASGSQPRRAATDNPSTQRRTGQRSSGMPRTGTTRSMPTPRSAPVHRSAPRVAPVVPHKH